MTKEVELSEYNKKMRGIKSQEDIDDDDREAEEEFKREGVGENSKYKMTSQKTKQRTFVAARSELDKEVKQRGSPMPKDIIDQLQKNSQKFKMGNRDRSEPVRIVKAGGKTYRLWRRKGADEDED